MKQIAEKAPLDMEAPRAKREAEANVDKITYMPGEGDGHKTVWNGIEFLAHVPKDIPRKMCGSFCNKKPCYCVMVPQKIRTPMKDEDTGKQAVDPMTGEKMWHEGVLQTDGTMQTKHVEKPMPMYKLAGTNPRFSVNGKRPAEQVKGSMRLPTDSTTYRAFAMNWIMRTNTAEELEARWKHESALREECGIGPEDIQWLEPFIEGAKLQLRAAAA